MKGISVFFRYLALLLKYNLTCCFEANWFLYCLFTDHGICRGAVECPDGI